MVHIKNNSRKNLAMSLRRGGYSYSEIKNFVSVSKSTLSFWFHDLKLSEPQVTRLQKKRSEAVRAATKTRSENVARAIEKIKMSAATDIGKISKRELWLLGVILYWRNYNKLDIKKGVSFSNTDPYLVRLFLKWLDEVGQLKREEIAFDLFLDKTKTNLKDAINFWSTCTNFPEDKFSHIYYLTSKHLKINKNKKEKSRVDNSSVNSMGSGYQGSFRPGSSNFGVLKIRVRASSMLARQLSGWIEGIQQILY